MELKEKAAYLKGLADGLELDKATKEGKLIAALIDLTQELCSAVEMLDTDMDEVVEELGELREYIEEQRIKKAIGRLISTDKPLTQIAYECGLSSQAYFSCVFKRKMKLTPREYAKKRHLQYGK